MEKEEQPNVKILVCCHKSGKWLSDDIYMPIQCGKAISDIDLGIQGDDTGDNISIKNPSYCELTAMYWAWKNLKDVDYIGLCHYRRYFNFDHDDFRNIIVKNNIEYVSVKKELLSKYDVILTKPSRLPYDLFTHYSIYHHSDDMRTVKSVIEDKFPCYANSFEKVMICNKLVGYNMFVMKKEVYDEYCTWLFSVLEVLEEKLNTRDYTNYNKRAIAFIAERLLFVYFYSKKLKLKFYPIYYIKEEEKELYSFVKWIIVNVANEVSFLFNKRSRIRL